MAFEGEIALGALNSKYKYGFTIGDIYRVQGAGNLVPNNYPAINGEFVEWTADGWQHSDAHYMTDAETVDIINENNVLVRESVFDNGAPSTSTVLRVSEDTYDAYNIGDYWTRGGILYKITNKIHAADSDVWQFGVKSVPGVVPAFNDIAGGGNLSNWEDVTDQITLDLNYFDAYNNFKVFKNNYAKLYAINFVAQFKNLSTSQTSWKKIAEGFNDVLLATEFTAIIPDGTFNYKCQFSIVQGELRYRLPTTSSTSYYSLINGPLIIPFE